MDASHFEVEHSIDGIEFSKIAKVKTTGFSTDLQNYQSFDTNPKSRANYYHLKLVSLDHSYKYSDITAIEIDRNEAFSIHPNPTKGSIKLNLSAVVEEAIIQLTDMNGHLLTQEIVDATSI